MKHETFYSVVVNGKEGKLLPHSAAQRNLKRLRSIHGNYAAWLRPHSALV